MSRRTKWFLLGAVVVVALAALPVALRRPSNERPWVPEQSRLPRISLRGDSAFIGDVRDFRWRRDSSAVPGWEDRAYDLRRVRAVWFGLSPFVRAWRGPAHTFLSFQFDDGSFLAVSVEARREVGERYSPLRGTLRQFELMYVIGDERDIVALRTNTWREPVYLYPGRATPDQARRLLRRVLERAQGLESRPEFYNSFTNSCASNIVDAIDSIWPHRIRHSWRVVLPGYSDELAYRLGLLDTTLPLDQARRRFFVNPRALAADGAPDFSRRIRAQ